MGKELDRDIEALLEFLDSHAAMPHAIGRRQNDCCSFALACAKATTGHARATRLHWTSMAGALRVIARFGPLLPDPSDPSAVGGLEAAIDHFFQRIAPAQAMRGDIGGVPHPEFGVHPMIVEGATLVGPAEGRGLRRLPRGAMVTAWSVTLPAPSRARAKT